MTSTVEVAVTDEIKDFSTPREPIRFKIDDDVFEAAPDVAAELMLRFADQAERLDQDSDATNDERIEILRRLFHLILLPDSAERFVARLNDPANPIGLATFLSVTEWLLERYGLRPTESDSAS